jgi:multiple sugar transport system permease protein
MVLASLRPNTEIFRFPAALLPETWDLSPYRAALARLPFWRCLGNSALAASVSVAGQMLVSALAAYALSKLRPAGRKGLFFLVLATLLIPFESVAIPLYLQMRAFPLGVSRLPHLNLLSSYWGLVLPSVVSAFSIYVLKNFFDRIPADLLNAARLDGASEWRIFATLALPLARPVLAILAVFAFLGAWNGFFWPLIVLNDPQSYTLMLGVQKLIENGEPWNVVMAAATLTTLPSLLVFLLLQRQINRGVAFMGLQG